MLPVIFPPHPFFSSFPPPPPPLCSPVSVLHTWGCLLQPAQPQMCKTICIWGGYHLYGDASRELIKAEGGLSQGEGEEGV
jgi:hypothetical protein